MPSSDRPDPRASVHLSQRDIDSLVRVADLYMSARPFRTLMRVTARGDIRSRFEYVASESKWLKRLAKETRADMRLQKQAERDLSLTIPALVGYWGRLLASLNTPRHRRRLSKSELATREVLLPRFQAALASLLPGEGRAIEEQIATRRPIEQRWMREALGLSAGRVEPETTT